VGSNVGIDFMEIGPLPWQQTSTSPLKGAGCRKTRRPGNDRISGQTKEKVIQDYVNRMYNQFVVDPHTKEPKNVDYPSSELVTKLVTFSYDLI
jgi:hypothetical protein